MKSGEYIQMIRFMKMMPQFISFYCECEQLTWLECAKRFDELQHLHASLKRELDSFAIYPRHDLSKSELIKQDLIRICTEFKIDVQFTMQKGEFYRKGIHAFYKYMQYEINDLIIFNEKRKKSHVSSCKID